MQQQECDIILIDNEDSWESEDGKSGHISSQGLGCLITHCKIILKK